MSLITSSIFLSNTNSVAGYIFAVFTFSVDLCDIILNSLIESTSSPQSSILIPVSLVIPISIIPPLILYSPAFSTKSLLS